MTIRGDVLGLSEKLNPKVFKESFVQLASKNIKQSSIDGSSFLSSVDLQNVKIYFNVLSLTKEEAEGNLYHEDIRKWSLEQADILKKLVRACEEEDLCLLSLLVHRLDLEHIADEISSLARQVEDEFVEELGELYFRDVTAKTEKEQALLALQKKKVQLSLQQTPSLSEIFQEEGLKEDISENAFKCFYESASFTEGWEQQFEKTLNTKLKELSVDHFKTSLTYH